MSMTQLPFWSLWSVGVVNYMNDGSVSRHCFYLLRIQARLPIRSCDLFSGGQSGGQALAM